MKIRMIETTLGSEDGVCISEYKRGCEYDMSHSAGARELAGVFVNVMRVAVVAGAERPQMRVETPSIEPLPEPMPEHSDTAAATPEAQHEPLRLSRRRRG